MDPPITDCVNRLIAHPPRTNTEASTLFAYFTSRLQEVGTNNVVKLQDSPIVPITRQQTTNGFRDEKRGSSIKHVLTRQCYLGKSEEYGEIFDFVDFGADANLFLLKCGAKQEPSIVELATLACQEPARLLGTLQGPEKYLNLLRKLAIDSSLKKNKTLWTQMKKSKFLLGYVEITGKHLDKREKSGFSDDEDAEDAPVKQYQLALPSQITIVGLLLILE